MPIPRRPLWSLPLLLAACATTGDPHADSVRQQETAGALLGGILGGVIGHQFGDGRGQTAMTVLGATAGAMVGGRLARDRAISDDERRAAYQALESAASGKRCRGAIRVRRPTEAIPRYAPGAPRTGATAASTSRSS